MAAKTYLKTALVTAEQFLPAIGQIPKGVYSDGHGDPRKRPDCNWVLDTKEGRHNVRGGDYICTGPAGEQWNVAKEIFEATYEEVDAPAPAEHVVGWQPIDTVPIEDPELIIVGSYNWRKQWCCEVWSTIYLKEQREKIAAGFFKDSPHLEWNPTHWMRLPAPPALASASEGSEG